MIFPDVCSSFNIGRGFSLRMLTLTKKDATYYWRCYNDPLVCRFIPDECIPYTINDAMDEISYIHKSFYAKKGIMWALVNENDEMIGSIGFHNFDYYHERIEIAYELRSTYWRKGLMSAAAKVLLDYAFNNLKVRRIDATTVTYNVPSMSLLEKIGFTREGILREYKFYKGERTDIVMFGYPFSKYQKDLQKFSIETKKDDIHFIDLKLTHRHNNYIPCVEEGYFADL